MSCIRETIRLERAYLPHTEQTYDNFVVDLLLDRARNRVRCGQDDPIDRILLIASSRSHPLPDRWLKAYADNQGIENVGMRVVEVQVSPS